MKLGPAEKKLLTKFEELEYNQTDEPIGNRGYGVHWPCQCMQQQLCALHNGCCTPKTITYHL